MDINSYLDNNFKDTTDGKVSLESFCSSTFTGQPSISNEGFSDFLASIRDWWNRPSKPSVAEMNNLTKESVEALRKRLEATYMDPKWMQRRKMNVNSIKIDNSYNFITVDGNIPLTYEEAETAIKDLHAKFKENALSRYEGFLTSLDLSIQNALRGFSFDPQYLNADILSNFAARINEIRSRVSIDYRVIFGNTRLSRTVMLGAFNDRPFDTNQINIREIDALTQDQITEVCKILIGLSEQAYEFSNFYEVVYHMRSRAILGKMISKVKEYIREVNRHYSLNNTPVNERGSLKLHEDFVDMMEEVRGIGGNIISYHMAHLSSIIVPYARLIDKTVR